MNNFTKSLLAISMAGVTAAAVAQPLTFQTYNPQSKGVFPVSATLISGDKNAILVDAQFSTQDAQQLVQWVHKSGKQLQTIVITAGDPDYYFGLEPLVKAFPKAEVIATPKVAAHIAQTKDAKLKYWGPILKEGAPQTLYVPKATHATELTLDGHKIEIKAPQSYAAYLWVPSSKTILGGVGIASGIHLWTADTQTPAARAEWRQTLLGMEKLHPTTVIPGHYVGEQPKGDAAIRFSAAYLRDFEDALRTHKKSSEVIATMKASYPHLADESSLDMSAKVNTGEMQWQ